jgi:hypothetical protein
MSTLSGPSEQSSPASDERVAIGMTIGETTLMALSVEFQGQFLELWEGVSDSTALGVCYSPGEQAINSREADRLIAFVEKAVKEQMLNCEQTDALDRQIIQLFSEFCENHLDFRRAECQMIFTVQHLQSTRDFIQEARQFDAALTAAALHQALRNVWVMNNVQILLEKQIRNTPSIFSYSLFYPYTDNMLDAPTHTNDEKQRFYKAFGERLAGTHVTTSNRLEDKVFPLVSRIENEFARQKYPQVYEGMLAILQAQLAAHQFPPQKERLLEATFLKGGSSVMAHGPLVAGQLGVEQLRFLFGYGVLLQLIDDLQDLQEDTRLGFRNYFTDTANDQLLDRVASRLFRFQSAVFATNPFRTELSPVMTSLLEKGCTMLILHAIACNPDYYSPGFYAAVDQASPLGNNYQFTNKGSLVKQGYSMIDVWGPPSRSMK